jgi:hypothetical protein
MTGSSVLLYCCSDVAHKLAVIISGQTMEIEAAASSKMMVPIYQTTWCHIPKDHNVCKTHYVHEILQRLKYTKLIFCFFFLGWLVIGPSTAGNVPLILFCGFVHGSNLTSNKQLSIFE